MCFLSTLLGILTIALLISPPAYAYIDPATGSFILQMLTASLLGALLTIKLWGRAVKQFLLRFLGKATPGPSDPAAEDTKAAKEEASK